MRRIVLTAGVVVGALGLLAAGPAWSAPASPGVIGASPKVTRVVYDSFEAAGGYDEDDYFAKWSNPYGAGEMDAGGTMSFDGGVFTAAATPFRYSVDGGLYDRLKYLSLSNESFPVPEHGSVEFSADIAVETPGTQPGRIIHGTYADGTPYSAATREAQQAAAVLLMVDYSTGQIFEWLVAGSSAILVIERLPASITGWPDAGTADTSYTQIIKEVPLPAGAHRVSIELSRTPGSASVAYRLEGKMMAQVQRIGIPLDKQGVRYTGDYPSAGTGELLVDRLDEVGIGHGLYSLLDPFPSNAAELPDRAVAIPVSERLFGQGAKATFDTIAVTTTALGKP